MRVRCTLLALFASAAVSAADDPAADLAPATPDHAEYVRLQQELERLAARNAWAGVERTYVEMLGTGVSLSFEDHLAGAHAARAIGDIGASRQRLSAANALRDGEREILEWLWDIDSNYGRVYLACLPGKHPIELAADVMPFHPDQRRAVEFAVAKIADTCEFDGLLPLGDYTFGGYDVEVQKVQTVRLDLRNMDPPPARRSKKARDSKKKDDDAAATE